MQTYYYDFTIRLHDTDAAGVLFFAHLYRYAHDAYEAFMANIGFKLEKLISEEVRLPLVHSEADIFKPIRQGDKIRICLQIQNIGHSSFSVSYLFMDQHNIQRATALTTHVNLDFMGQKSQHLPEDILKALNQYCVAE